MGIVGRGTVLATVLAVTVAAGVAQAGNNPNGTAFRAVGWFKGKGEITAQSIQCEIPTLTSAIADGAFAMGLLNTFGVPTLYFPDINGVFANPCGGWIEVQNNLINQAINVSAIKLNYKIAGAGQFRQLVPTRNAFPIACRQLRRATVFTGGLLNPINSTIDTSGAGAPNVTFIEVLPLVSTQLFTCLQSQYAPLPSTVFTSLPLVIQATVTGTADGGNTYHSNPITYTLNLRHLCGNGRLDDGELCDPTTPFNSCVADTCTNAVCGISGRPCVSNADCAGTCQAAGTPSECVCVY